jgi:hypothetical protein
MRTKQQRDAWKADKARRLEDGILSGQYRDGTSRLRPDRTVRVRLFGAEMLKASPLVARSGTGAGRGLDGLARRVARRKKPYSPRVHGFRGNTGVHYWRNGRETDERGRPTAYPTFITDESPELGPKSE